MYRAQASVFFRVTANADSMEVWIVSVLWRILENIRICTDIKTD